MQSPSVMFIEAAVDTFKDAKYDNLKDWQQQELTSFGDYRAQQYGATGLSDDFRKGYELGLSTARVIILMSPAVVLHGVKPDDVL